MYNLSDYDFILYRNGNKRVTGKFKENCINALKDMKTIRARTIFHTEKNKYQVLSANHKEGHKCIEFIRARD